MLEVRKKILCGDGLMDNSHLALRAEHLAKLAGEAETKKEAAAYWREYRQIMIRLTGDPNLFKRPKNPVARPSKALIRTIRPCVCGSSGCSWKLEGEKVKLFCKKCERTTHMHTSNSKARDEWNAIQALAKGVQ